MRRNNNMGMGNRGGGGGSFGPMMRDHLLQASNPPCQMYENRFDAPPRRDFPPPFGEPLRRPAAMWAAAPGERLEGPSGFAKRPRPGPPPPAPPRMGFIHNPPNGQNPQPFRPNFMRDPQPPRQNNSPSKKPTSKSAPKKPSSVPVSNILTAGMKPCPKMNGRLEMAVGILLIELKEAHRGAEYASVFGAAPLVRLLRHGLRERLRAAMLGKAVDSVPSVVAEYRKAFPPTMDADLLKLTEIEEVDRDQKLAITLIEKGSPDLFFKKNMTKLLEVKLDEMFQKAEKLHNDEDGSTTSEVLGYFPEVKAPTEDSLKVDTEETAEQLAAEDHPRAQEYDKWMARLLGRKLPALLAQHKDKIIKLLDLDQMFGSTKAAVVKRTGAKKYTFRKPQYNISQSEFLATLKDEPTAFLRKCPYSVQLHASPAMPSHGLFQVFLKKFNPMVIKRSKKIFNLLFLGFSNKDDYDRILKADQTKIGTSTLTIVGNGIVAKTEYIEIKDEKSDVLDQVLTPQLDDQINDLLASIIKTEGGTNSEIKTEKVSKEHDVIVEDEVLEVTNDDDGDVVEVKTEAEVVAIDDDEMAAT